MHKTTPPSGAEARSPTPRAADMEDIERRTQSLRGAVVQLIGDSDPGDMSALLVNVGRLYGQRPRDRIQSMIRTACELAALLLHAREQGVAQGVDADTATALVDDTKCVLHRITEFLYYLDQAVSSATASHHVLRVLAAAPSAGGGGSGMAAASTSDYELAAGIARFSGMDGGGGGGPDLNNVQQLIIYMLNITQSRGLRRWGTDCYERILTPDGHHATRAWTRACSIKDLLFEVTRKELNFDQWVNITRGKSNMQSVIDYLGSCVDVQFPELRRDRRLFAFRNGLYAACRSRVLDRVPPAHRSQVQDAFVPYGAHEDVLPDSIAACKYFDCDFPEDQLAAGALPADLGWSSIPTPHLASIMDYQQFEPDVCTWMYALIGRLLYEVNELDGWQVIPYLKGQASSGKSTILLNVCRFMYDTADVGVLSNNVERKFGIAAFADKFLFVAPEIKSDLQLEQAEFQSMVSGEALQLAAKFQTARTVDWSVPGILAGNEVPAWVDNSGSIGRRVVIFDFIRKVSNGDADLGRKLQAEIPYVMLKCNRAYHAMVRKVGADNIWAHLPDYFKRTKNELAESINPVQHFMGSGKLAFGPDAYMPLDDWKRAFRAHCEENNFQKVQLTKNKYEPVMFDAGMWIDKSSTARPYPRPREGADDGCRLVACREWCMGAELASYQGSRSPHQAAGGGGDVFEDVMV